MSKERILVVDDDEYVRELFSIYLEELDYDCTTANDGEDCLNKFSKSDNWDVVLLDIHMPKLDGLETLRALHKVNPDLSVVMVSASKDAEDVKEALRQGAYDYIFKPFSIDELETVIKRATERSRLIRLNREYQASLERKVASQTEELFNLYADTMHSMILALDLREKETGFHSFRVTEYALTLARRLNLPEETLSGIAKGALLHDVGKIGVPDSILLKPDKLTPEEWEIMKKHPILGYELIKNIKFLENAAKLVLYHHERFDGTGYPYGVKGFDIPLEARVFSVADALDAITTDRVYRKAMNFQDASRIIRDASGSQFDPAVVEVFSSVSHEEWKSLRRAIDESGTRYLKDLLYKLI
ncbi:MAG: response regulator [Candidatus Methanosuratincola sp.]|jgi:putative nucleotidyltransferase with HDIG domain